MMNRTLTGIEATNNYYRANRARKGIEMRMNDMREMVIAAINEVDTIESTATNQEILDLGLQVASMDWEPEALEWLAREWSFLELGKVDTETVANMIAEWQFGYRCEEEDQPSILLEWASTKSSQWADRIHEELKNRVMPMVESVKADLANGIPSDKAWCAAVEDGDWTEHDIRLAEDIVG